MTPGPPEQPGPGKARAAASFLTGFAAFPIGGGLGPRQRSGPAKMTPEERRRQTIAGVLISATMILGPFVGAVLLENALLGVLIGFAAGIAAGLMLTPLAFGLEAVLRRNR